MRIKQITSAAPGWFAALREDGGGTFLVPIAFWQLTSDKEFDSVQGVDPTGEGWGGCSACDTGNFIEFVFDPSAVATWPASPYRAIVGA
jgi:hypothetical protein